MKHRMISLLLLLGLAFSLTIPASALLFTQGGDEVSVASFAKNGPPTEAIRFSEDDFIVSGDGELAYVVLDCLPSADAGLLKIGEEELRPGDSISMNAVSGMRFYPLSVPTVLDTSFQITPVFSDGLSGDAVTVSLYLLDQENAAPIAENLTMETYKNVAITGKLAAIDPEGDLLTFQMMGKPARGSIELYDDGTFLYTPYENKTGKDAFTYVAMDSVGNVSKEASVKITITKAQTKVTYADMSGNPAYRSALRLAEEGVLVGSQVDGVYYFQPNSPVSRDEFVAMAMSAAGLKSLDGVNVTGFADDAAIPSWAKGYVSAALRSGVVQGIVDESGDVCFRSDSDITKAEAAVIVNRLLNVSDVAVAETMAQAVPAWASQAAANMSAVSVLTNVSDLEEYLTRAEAADMLCAMLDVLERRNTGWF